MQTRIYSDPNKEQAWTLSCHSRMGFETNRTHIPAPASFFDVKRIWIGKVDGEHDTEVKATDATVRRSDIAIWSSMSERPLKQTWYTVDFSTDIMNRTWLSNHKNVKVSPDERES